MEILLFASLAHKCMFGMEAITFASISVTVTVQIIILLIWGLKWR